jgi:hypothetical protein
MFENNQEIFPIILEEELKGKTLDLSERECFDYTNHDENTTQGFPLLNVDGYRQNSRYFNFLAHDIRRFFTFRSDLKSTIQSKIFSITSKILIGLHVRRGDYINTISGVPHIHDICTKNYFFAAINFFREKSTNAHVLIFTDDKKWCQENIMPKLSNASISPFDSEQDDFIGLSLCQFKIISNSTFAWWAAWLDARFTSEVIAPRPWIRQEDKAYERIYPPNWHIFDINTEKLDIKANLFLNIGAYYQCYKQPCAFVNACQSFRRVYPESTLLIVSDDGNDFSKAATYFNAKSYKRNSKRGGNGTTTHITAFEHIMTFVVNFLQAAKQITESYYILLEDDLSVIRALEIPSDVNFDIIGNNSLKAKFPKKLQNYFKGNHTYYGACGGSLFKTKFWANLNSQIVEQQLKEFRLISDDFHTDMVLSFLCYCNGGLICCGQESFTSEFVEKIDFKKQRDNMPAVYHPYKELYNRELNQIEKDILAGKKAS